MKEYDFIVIGSGIAGLYTALLAASEGSVLILTKGHIDDCNTRFAQGGIAAAISIEDSIEMHFEDTINASVILKDVAVITAQARQDVIPRAAGDGIGGCVAYQDVVRLAAGTIFNTVN